MRASLIQRQLRLNADVLTGLHEEYSKLRKQRKEYNEEADGYSDKALKLDQDEQFEAAEEAQQSANTYRAQAAIFTPYIKKFAKKIAGLQQVQVALKLEAKDAARIDAWSRVEDAFWLQQANIAQEGGYATPDSVDALFVSFPVGDE